MAKNMARIENGTVINVEWCADYVQDTDTLISVADRPVGIGDTYDGTDFFRDGEKVLTPLEDAQAKNAEYEAALAEIEAVANVPMATGEDAPTITERKDAIVAVINDMLDALNTLGVTPNE